MKIIADAAIPCIRHYFAGFGDLELLDGRDIDAAAVRDADILIVRTITRVDGALLDGSRVRFVATATSGVDHVDTTFLAEKGIGFAPAAGCNARAVAEYVLSSLLVLTESRGQNLADLRVGIVGCGHVGSTLYRFLTACGVDCLVCDPPLQKSSPDSGYPFVSRDEIRSADVVSLHVPLVSDGEHPTADMLGSTLLNGLREDVIVINTSRGEVVDESALIRFLDARPSASAVLDVWRNEPCIDTELLRRVAIGTAHIAGYSLDAKLRGTRMVYEAVCRHLGREEDIAAPPLPEDGTRRLSLTERDNSIDSVAMAVLASYDVRADAAALTGMQPIEAGARDDYFTGLRHDYPLRREFPAMTVDLYSRAGDIADILSGLGFQVNVRT